MQEILYLEDDYQYNSFLSEKLKFDLPDKLINLHSFTDVSGFFEKLKTSEKNDFVIIDYSLADWSEKNPITDIIKDISTNSKVIIYSASHNSSFMSLDSENENIYFLPKTLNTFDRIKEIIDKTGRHEETNVEPKLTRIKDDIKVINNSLIEIIAQNPTLVYDIHPRQFEELVAELFFKEGYTVELTPSTNDGGKDIYAFKKDIFNHYLFAVECKKYSQDNKVGRPIIQRLNGVVEAERLTGGILVTTSFFTKQAIEFSKQLSNRIFLNDYFNLIELINKHKVK